jgi:hypothetical protein
LTLTARCSTENHQQRPLTPTQTRTPRQHRRHLLRPLTPGAKPIRHVAALVLAVPRAAMAEATAALRALSVAGRPRPRPDVRPMPLLSVDTSSSRFPVRAYGSQQAPNPSNVLGVFGLSIRTQERDLDEEFSRFGRVEKVTIVYDQRVGRFFVLWIAFGCRTYLPPSLSSLIDPEGSVSSRWQQSRRLLDASTSSMAL